MPSGYLGTDEKAPLYPYDPAKAKALLTEAGYPNGVTIKTIHTTLTGMQTLIEAVQAQLKKAGINLDIELVEHATFHAQIRKDLSPIVHYQAARFPVADVYLTQFFDSASIVGTPTAVTNFSHCNVADDDIRAARAATDAGQAEGAVEVGAGEDHQDGLRGSGLRAAAALGVEGHARPRLRPAGLAQPVAADHGEDALHEVSAASARDDAGGNSAP